MLRVEHQHTINKPLEERLEILRKLKLPEICILKTFTELSVDDWNVPYLRSMLKKQNSQRSKITLDGIVFSSMDDPYQETVHLKIKPKRMLTNDYLLKWKPKFKSYELWTRGRIDDYFQCNATYSDKADNGYHLFPFAVPFIINNQYS